MEALLARYPGLGAALPRVLLGVSTTPLERWTVGDTTLLIKRDDLSAPRRGGNKVRALELLLAGVPQGHEVLTVGATGSTHALAVAEHAGSIGVRTQVVTWPQEEHDVARATAARMASIARVTRASSVGAAYLRAFVRRARGPVHWIPAGGSTAIGALGHAAAAMELAAQLDARQLAAPVQLVVPLGTGGTAAGLLAGLALAGLRTRVVGVQVVPRVVARHAHVVRLARQVLALVRPHAGVDLPAVDPSRLEIERGAYGGAYGRETVAGRRAGESLAGVGGPALEPTYSAKAFAVALDRARRSPAGTVLFWLTFDGRGLDG